jgi:hypothetical protein
MSDRPIPLLLLGWRKSRLHLLHMIEGQQSQKGFRVQVPEGAKAWRQALREPP